VSSAADILRVQEIERQVIGSAFRNPDAAQQWPLSAEDFTDPMHGAIWGALKEAIRKGDPSDPVTVGYLLDEQHPGQGLMATCGAISRDYYATATTGAHAAKIVRDRGVERAAVSLANKFAAKVIDQTELVAGLKRLAMQRDIPAYTVAHSIRELIDYMANPPAAVPTGIERLDAQFSGLHRGDLVLLQARPSIGKTALAVTLARNMVKTGVPTLFYSGEMPEGQIVGRLIAQEANVPAYKFRSGKLSEAEWARFNKAAQRMQEHPLFTAYKPTPALDDIVNVAHRMKEQQEIQVLLVDYAQRIKVGRQESRRDAQIQIAQTMKGLAGELDICIVLLAQSGRQVDDYEAKSYGKMPQMSDVQESAAYEQEADMMIGLARNGAYAMIDVQKNRHGPTGMVPLEFYGETMEFRSVGADRVVSIGQR
jgi:replicative DNA helicase